MTVLEQNDRPTARDCARTLTEVGRPGSARPGSARPDPARPGSRFVPRRWFRCCGRRDPDRVGKDLYAASRWATVQRAICSASLTPPGVSGTTR
ncbi:hypothetical protein Shyd_91060 [Streptomyces hydrogenans]|uniref:Uncharacterized protein n=1 Tax=Streptomyces hydrogenans TaxID=1873719 RepID=A0ABQ3PRT5_9ACTN|nr:hypothetical protein GCM10018784_18720 [Streptomyces hydrogenans]GHI27735.1 hypothetical protein Shyd_91060 [Streptomyces hydrogenans]